RGAERLEGGDMDRVLHRADLEALHVGGGLDGMTAVGQVAKALFTPGERNEVARREPREQVLADLAVQDRAGMREVTEQERNVGHSDFGDEVAERAARDDHRLEGAELEAFDGLAFAAERARGELLEDQLALAQLFRRLRPGRG